MEQRLTLISDATDEFANNKNNEFRVRIPNGLRLEGKGWHVALLSLTLPNSTRDTAPFTMNSDKELLRIGYTVTRFSQKLSGKYTALVFAAQTDRVIHNGLLTAPAKNGVEYWGLVVDEVDRDIKNRVDAVYSHATTVDSNFLVLVKRSMRPSFRWDGEDLILEAAGNDTGQADDSSTTLYSYFDMSYEVAMEWGFLKLNGPDIMLGDNCAYTIDNVTITDDFPPRTSAVAIAGVDDMNGPAHAYQTRFDRPPTSSQSSTARLFWKYTIIGKGHYVRFSRFAEWRFKHLNDTFHSIHSHPSKAVLVYTNLQQSTVVGNTKVQLLRELVVKRGTEHGEHTYTEPLHLQWIPVSTHNTDIVEVQLADVNGALLQLPKGKSLVTLALKQMV